ncbi:CoB--CoM heterodisulfide reductase subunit C [Thermogutta terrifontis]|jgi:heterodisulfide reductase subunit C|uniref:CoB--CoM heterodisulfide reductase subunit C n=2 Tax=Thermogutta TaxID=1676125 RepID=A0A286RLR9_9BACT|nr:4Fe-4S dicluster domain-containing protein [Thermogutta terrifontis]ASV76908.1 CoB--CoM heterodisulfide reductase subunit C [Thermogutta terrifontis]
MVGTTLELRGSPFFHEIIREVPGGERIVRCLQCGTCGGSCPNGADMEYTPRTIFAMIAANEREKVLKANTMWFCVSCYFCVSRCPQKIPITDIMYGLKRIAIRERMYRDTDAPALAKTFTDLLDKYGRSFELGLASRYYLFNRPLAMLKMGPLGLSMFTRGRMALSPTRIKNIDQLQAIIRKARELGGHQS